MVCTGAPLAQLYPSGGAGRRPRYLSPPWGGGAQVGGRRRIGPAQRGSAGNLVIR
ncbi:hypothetical protein ACFPRL_22370 [Pseudoclavibacter helvolus]